MNEAESQPWLYAAAKPHPTVNCRFSRVQALNELFGIQFYNRCGIKFSRTAPTHACLRLVNGSIS